MDRTVVLQMIQNLSEEWNKSTFCRQVLCRFIQMLLHPMTTPNSKSVILSHWCRIYNSQFQMQHPLERPILMDKLFWRPEEKTDFRNYPELGFWVWTERQDWMALPKTYRDSQAWRGLDGKWTDVSTLFIWVMNYSSSKGSWLLHQGRFTQT